MNKEPKKRYIIDREEEPSYDIRNVFPEIIDDIHIIGDISKIMNEEQFNYLRDNHRIVECGYDGQTQYIKLQYLFTIDDIRNKIEEICKGDKDEL